MIAIFVFYNKAQGVQSKLAFSKEFKHVNVITYDGMDWILIDFLREGITTRRIKCKNGEHLLRTLPKLDLVSGIITVCVDERVKIPWKLYLVRSCNEIARYASGVDIGLTFNPRHLWSKLLKYSKGYNYEVLSVWRRDNGISGRGQ